MSVAVAGRCVYDIRCSSAAILTLGVSILPLRAHGCIVRLDTMPLDNDFRKVFLTAPSGEDPSSGSACLPVLPSLLAVRAPLACASFISLRYNHWISRGESVHNSIYFRFIFFLKVKIPERNGRRGGSPPAPAMN